MIIVKLRSMFLVGKLHPIGRFITVWIESVAVRSIRSTTTTDQRAFYKHIKVLAFVHVSIPVEKPRVEYD